MCVGAHGAGNLPDRDLLAGHQQTLPASRELCVVSRQDQPESDGLGVNAMRATDGRCSPMFLDAPTHGFEHGVQSNQEPVGRFHQEQSQ